MRTLFASLALVLLLPLSAMAATIDDVAGTWKVDVPHSMRLNPDVPQEQMEQLALLILAIDAKAGTVTAKFSDEEEEAEVFTVQKQTSTSVTLKLGDDSVLRIDREGKTDISVGEMGEDGKRESVLYFKRAE